MNITKAELWGNIVMAFVVGFVIGVVWATSVWESRMVESGYKLVRQTPAVSPWKMATITPVEEGR